MATGPANNAPATVKWTTVTPSPAPAPQATPSTSEALAAAEERAIAGDATDLDAIEGMATVNRTGDRFTITPDGRLVPRAATRGLTAPRTTTLLAHPDLTVAIDSATRKLDAYVAKMTTSLTSEPFIMVPFDGTRRYRLGNIGTDGYGMTQGQLTARRDRLLAKGFPEYDFNEASVINTINFGARASTGKAICLQHFPGGGPELETTEKVPVHYSDPAQIASYVQSYRDVMRIQDPQSIMLSHASYTRDGLPGMSAIDDNRDPRPGFLRDIPFDKLPASLNPSMVRYLRDNMQHKGLVVPDWYNMGAVDAFVRDNIHINLGPEAPKGSDDEMLQSDARKFILGLEAGVDQIPGLQPALATEDAIWNAFQHNHPAEYAAMLQRLDERVRDTYGRIAPQGAPAIDPAKFSRAEKMMMLMYNPKQSVYRENIAPFIRADADPYKRQVIGTFMDRGLGDYDVWNRTGVLTLMFRQSIVESLTGKKFPSIASPRGSRLSRDSREVQWFQGLMANAEFRAVYDRIPWTSPQMQRMYRSALQHRHPQLVSRDIS